MARAAFLTLLLSLIVLPGVSTAADAPEEPAIDLARLDVSRRARQYQHPVSSRVNRYGTAAMETLSGGDAEAAKALLEKLNLRRLNPHERAQVHRLLGYMAYQVGDLELAVDRFALALDEEILSLRDDVELRFNIAQLHAAQSQWREVIASLDRWARYVEQRSPLSHYLMAIAYYQLNEPGPSILHAEKAVDLAPEPKEGWLQLLAALHVKNQDYKSAAPVLEELVMRFRKKEYWSQLSLIYGALDDFQGSLAVQQIAYLQDFLTEDKELRRLARGYLYNELPYPAARVLEEGIAGGAIEPDAKGYELLANSWIAAREYDASLEPLRQAADLSEEGNLYVRLGQVHMQREEWSEAVRLLGKAIAKGDLKEPGNVHLLLGISHYNDASVAHARASFARARKHEDTRSQADLWIEHLEREAQQAG